MLKNVRDVLVEVASSQRSQFPARALDEVLNIQYPVTDLECENYLKNSYQWKYTRLILSLMYPDREWKGAVFHEDHIFPKSEFELRKLHKRGYGIDRIERCTALVNLVPNLELLTDTENLEKNASPFEEWLRTRDEDFIKRHTIPVLPTLEFEAFERFFEERSALLREKLKVTLGNDAERQAYVDSSFFDCFQTLSVVFHFVSICEVAARFGHVRLVADLRGGASAVV
jgi:hypothetical protein